MKEGTTIQAEVIDVRDNGLYLRAEGLSGFINVTELTWAPGGVTPSDFATVGDTIVVLVYAVTESGFYASLKQLDPMGDPFRDLSIYHVGARHHGRVWSLATYGVFVLLESGAVGLIRPGGEQPPLEIGERVDVEVVSFDAYLKNMEVRLV